MGLWIMDRWKYRRKEEKIYRVASLLKNVKFCCSQIDPVSKINSFEIKSFQIQSKYFHSNYIYNSWRGN